MTSVRRQSRTTATAPFSRCEATSTSGGCPRLNYWSNPNKLYNGAPMGTTTRSDNTRVLNNTRGTVAAFR